LLSWTWIALTIEVDNAFEVATSDRIGRHVRISLPMWTNGLRLIGEDGVTVEELRSRAGAACNIGGLERWGWITVGDGDEQRRDGYGSHRDVKGNTILRPTRAGAYARRLWPHVMDDVATRWRSRFGSDTIEELHAALPAVVRSLRWSPPGVHPADGLRTHVIEGNIVDVVGPFVARIGQALSTFTLEHEDNAKVSLPLAANVVRAAGADTVRLRDLPAMTGLSREAIAMAAIYLGRHGLATSSPGRAMLLTRAGRSALTEYQRQAAVPKDERLQSALEAILDQRDTLSAGLASPPGCWRSETPYLAQTKRLMADPIGGMPWHPMVLHRGAWPDGS
jgi:hypothetical protein